LTATGTAPKTSAFNTLAVFTFTSASAGTLSYYGSNVVYATTGTTMTTADTGSAVPFTVASATYPAGAMTISFNVGGVVSYNAVAINGGNTILMQQTDSPSSGVCQF
jgi:hypothetical protein